MFSAILLGLFRLNVEYEVEHKFLLLPVNEGLSPSVKGKIKKSMETWLGMAFLNCGCA